MNRGRIGLGLLAAGAGVAARRKLRQKLDPSIGPAYNEDIAASERPVSDKASGITSTAATAPTVIAVDHPPAGVPSAPAPSDPLSPDTQVEEDGATLGSPEIGNPEIAPEVQVEPAAALFEASSPSIGLGSYGELQSDAGLTARSLSGTQVASPAAVVVAPADSSVQPVAAAPDPTPIEPTTAKPAPPVPRIEPPASPNLISGTEPPALAATEPPARPRFWRRRVGGWSVVTLGLVALLGIAAFVASVVRLPYYRLQPGSVYDTIERVEAPGDLVFLPEGEINFVTVSQTANITPWQWLDAQLDENVRIRHEDEVRGEQTADEARANDLRRMQVSKNSAVVVALQKLGFELIITPIGVEVAQVFECSAADGTLGTGDLIVGVNGVPTPDGERLIEQLINAGIGQEVELLVERIDPANPTQSMRTDVVELTLGSIDDPCLDDSVRDDEARPFIGIQTQTMFEEDLPVDVDVRTGRVGGPSAGLAFTLAIMDVLSEGELTNGLNIVATGTIDRDGNVGPVGGIHQKTIAAERSGADIFLVPACCDNFVDRTSGEALDLPSNFEEAQLHADDMLVVGVENLDDALRAIGELGGDVEAFLDS